MSFQQLKVIVWKNLIIRKRHWFLTLLESILPIILFLLIAYGMGNINTFNRPEVGDVIYDPTSTEEGAPLYSQVYIYYTPNTQYYQDLIGKMRLKFTRNEIQGFNSTQDLLDYHASHDRDNVYGVIFNSDDSKTLDYTIRYGNGYNWGLSTSELYLKSYNFFPGIGSLYMRAGLLSFQKTLDVAFIENSLKSSDLQNIDVLVQEFPYPAHRNGSTITDFLINYLPIMTLFSFIFLCPAVLKRVVEEKYTGIKELLKMVGMKSWMLWLGWFIYGMIPLILACIVIIVMLKVPLFGAVSPPIDKADGSLLFVFFLLYCMAAVIFCFAISSLFSRPTLAVVAGILIWILSYFVPVYAIGLDESNTKIPWSSSMLLLLLPNMALHYGFSSVASYEERDIGLQWNNFHKAGSGDVADVSMLNVFLMLILDMVIYMLLTFYMDAVNPGKYGVRKSVIFPVYSLVKVVKKFRKKPIVSGSVAFERLDNVEEGRDLKEGIEIEHLCKKYGHKMAVNDLNMSIYQQQITVLLGHNGAGKSTTMSMITGMIDITSGSVKMDGVDIANNMDKLRNDLGLCPQHNLLFTDLTVGEHLKFFAMLKGRTNKEAKEDVKNILQTLNLSEKKSSLANTLSGGMKRKLCLGMAVIGGSRVLILDEPTSGMDPESRRELWDLLLSWRGEKTILITTHFMEEADALGDWIAIMAQGTLQCYGTPMFLKKKYDTGYHLSLMVNGSATEKDKNEIRKNVSSIIPDAHVNDMKGNNMVFVLPFERNMQIPDVLSRLEDKKKELKINNISISITTLEDVFLKAKSEIEPKSKASNGVSFEEPQLLTRKPPNRMALRVYALFVKKLQFFKKKILMHLVSIFIAAIFVFLGIILTDIGGDTTMDEEPLLKLELDAYKQTTLFYSGDDTGFTSLKSSYKKLIEATDSTATDVTNVSKAILDKGRENIIYYKEHMVVSAKFERSGVNTTATALYNAVAAHSAPISLNLVTNSLAKVLLGEEYSISVSNLFLPKNKPKQSSQEISEVNAILPWVIMPIGFLFIMASLIILPHMEVATTFIQLQYMCGVKPYVYWCVNFLVDLVFCMIVLMLMVLAMVLLIPFLEAKDFGIMIVLFLLYAAASIPFVYLFTRRLSASGAYALFVILGMFLGLILAAVVAVLMMLIQVQYYNDIGEKIKIISMIFLPQFGLTYSGLEVCIRAVQVHNAPYIQSSENCKDNPCCSGTREECTKFKNYWTLLQYNFLLMFVSCVIYLTINILWDTYLVKKWVHKCVYKIRSLIFPKSGSIIEVQDGIRGGLNTLNARNLQKSYSGKQVVKGIGFSLKHGECLGILGVNGAGKTTTFRMLTREEVLDDGVVEIEEETGNIDINQGKYLQNLGYCPQTDALNFVLTGRQILRLMARLRGVNDPKVVDFFLDIFELKEYADLPCGHYSGGNKRKLNLAIAIIGYPKYVLLDEPTNGVDPSSRRKFWTLIKRIQEKKRLAFILTSHSMVECEALCDNLKIMKSGKFEKEGTISELKREFGGFSIKLKLCNKLLTVESTAGRSVPTKGNVPHFDTISSLKEYFIRQYDAELKDEHSGLLHFYVNDKNRKWSVIFREMEGVKNENQHLIEDYAISEASLEDIFLSVARSEDQEENPKKKKRFFCC